MQSKETHNYDDIIHRTHPVSQRHLPMARGDRAAQFSPFAALVGFDAAIEETARQTESWIQLDTDGQAMVDEQLRAVQDRIGERPRVVITHFLPDQRKSGGVYVCSQGRVKRIDTCARQLCLTDGRTVPLEMIFRIAIAETSVL